MLLCYHVLVLNLLYSAAFTLHEVTFLEICKDLATRYINLVLSHTVYTTLFPKYFDVYLCCLYFVSTYFLALLNIYSGLLDFISAVKYWHERIILSKFA